MSLTAEQLRDLARASLVPDPTVRRATLDELGDPSPEQLGRDAVVFLDDADRNVRVKALRVLAWCDGEAAVQGVLRGLDDPMKRVREVAAKCSARFVDDPRVADRLRLAVERGETGSARTAVSVLAGVFHSPFGLSSTGVHPDAVRRLLAIDAQRGQALAALLRARTLTDDVAELLREVVRTGTKDEAVAATRRLCGFRVAHHGELDADTRRGADQAWGAVWFWVRVPEER